MNMKHPPLCRTFLCLAKHTVPHWIQDQTGPRIHQTPIEPTLLCLDPNIVGSVDNLIPGNQGILTSGAFQVIGSEEKALDAAYGSKVIRGFSFDASADDATYSGSSVQTNALQVLACIKVWCTPEFEGLIPADSLRSRILQIPGKHLKSFRKGMGLQNPRQLMVLLRVIPTRWLRFRGTPSKLGRTA